MSNHSQQIVQKLWNYCNILRDDGLSYGDYVEQLTFLLFLKMADEQTKPPYNKPSIIPKNYDWESLLKRDGDELEIHYRHLLETLGKEKGLIGVIFRKAQNKIQDPAKLRRLVVDLIDREQWTSLDADVKGDAYEGLLQKNAEDVKGGAGQYFTPRPLIRAIVDVMRPEPGMAVCDPACGTGGFLLATHDFISHNYQLDKDQKKHLKFDMLRGVELVDGVARLCVMNLVLHGIGGDTGSGADVVGRVPSRGAVPETKTAGSGDPAYNPNRGATPKSKTAGSGDPAYNPSESPIDVKDSLAGHPGEYFEMVMTNPPFGKKSSVTVVNEQGEQQKESLVVVRDDFWASTSNKQLNFLQHVFTILKQHGRAAIVVPDNVLFEGGAGETVRRKLLHEADVHTLLRLPTGIFYAQGVKANLLFFDRKPASETPWTKTLWIYDLRTNRHFTLKDYPLQRTDLDDFVKCFNPANRHQRSEAERFKPFAYDDLIKRDKVNLDIFWLKDESLEDSANLPDPDVIAQEIADDLQAALEQFESILSDLKK